MPWRSTGVALETLASGAKREVLIEGATVLLVRLGPGVTAIEGICSHEGGLLADGTVENEQVTCPKHGAIFDVTTGQVVADPDGVIPPTGVATPLPRYTTRVEGGIVWVELP
jgi:3-phenylpropionate/trans-cinnamate dioxygenase ferredoxin subunit